MAIFLGQLGITDIRIGTSAVTAVYVGTNLVYPNAAPSPYQDCGCIYGRGENVGEYIELPFKSSSTLKIRFYGQLLAYSGGIHIGCLYNNTAPNRYRLFVNSATIAYWDIGTVRATYRSSNYGSPMALNTDMDITFGNGFITNNLNSVTTSFSQGSSVPNTLPLLVRIPALKIFALQAWETSGGTDELIFDGVPKIRVSDNQPGLYDNVGQGFYTNPDTTINACSVGT